MYNTDLPNRAELPSSRQLLRSTIIAIVVAAVLLVTVVLPSEYGIDPTRLGRVLGLTRMGEIKMSLAREAEQDRAAATAPVQQSAVTSPPPPAQQTQNTANPSAPRTDEMSVTLKPGGGAEVKLEMSKGAKVSYEWTTAGGPVNHDTHGDNPQVDYHGYSKGQQMERDSGELTAVFDGKHGWFWRNRGNAEVTVTLKTNGVYRSIKRVM
ncbi:MAG: transmembrane anchor protein [Acidobacteriota bacterium]|nr:transmembrane anchor protein [Acidobacteriota bacterium]